MKQDERLVELVKALRCPGNASRVKGMLKDEHSMHSSVGVGSINTAIMCADALDGLGSRVYELPVDLQRAVELYTVTISQQVRDVLLRQHCCWLH